jgi:signal transduction histidine kinase/CHASE3 domain sensor protein
MLPGTTLETKRQKSGIGQSLTIHPTYVNKRPIVMLSLVLAIIATSCIYMFWQQAASVIHTSEQLSKSRDLVSCLDNTLSTLRDAESSERGYVVTADPTYLKPYYSSRQLLNKHLMDLRGLTTSSELKHKVSDLEVLMREEVAEMDKTVSLRTPQNFRNSWLVVVRGRGKQIMDEVTAAITSIKANEEAIASKSAHNVRDANRTIMTTLPVILIVAAIMVGLLVIFCFKFMNEKKLSELRLSHSYKLFESFMDNSPSFAFIKNKEGKYLYINKSLAARFATDGEPVIGRCDIDWLPADVAENIAENDKTVLRSNNPIRTIEIIPNTSTDYQETWVVIKFPVTDLANNGFVGGVAIDISDMKKAEQQIAELNQVLHSRISDLEMLTSELESARDQAMSASKLKSQFIANMSHEIRTPMSGLLGMSELLLTSELDVESRELVTYIHSSANNLLAVVNDLLDFAKLEAGKVVLDNAPFSIKDLLEDAINSATFEAQKKSLSLTKSIGATVPDLVVGDSGKLRQILLNLTHNAVKFTPSGSINLTTNIVAQKDQNMLIAFEVEDTGIGITEEAQQKLFEPFVQADGSTTRQYGGTGLGLSICKSLVELMAGRIGVRSDPSEGSTFWFTVPLKTVASKQEEEDAA